MKIEKQREIANKKYKVSEKFIFDRYGILAFEVIGIEESEYITDMGKSVQVVRVNYVELSPPNNVGVFMIGSDMDKHCYQIR